MQSREWQLFLKDMIENCQRAQRFTAGMTLSSFVDHEMAYLATVRSLERIGEAAAHVPDDIRQQLPDVEWRRIVGLRNVLIHAYPMIDDVILWGITQAEVPKLERALREFLDQR